MDQAEATREGVVLYLRNLPWETTEDDVKQAVKEASGVDVDAQISKRKDGRSRGYATVRVSDEECEKLIELSEKITIDERDITITRRKRKGGAQRRGARKTADSDGEEEDNKAEPRKQRSRRRRRRRPRGDRKKDGDETANDGAMKAAEKKDGVLLFFGNVPWKSTSEDIQSVIETATGIKTDVKVSMRGSGRSRGYATARCNDEEAEKLMNLSGELAVGERKLRIEQKKKRRVRRPRRARTENSDKNEAAETAGDAKEGEGEE